MAYQWKTGSRLKADPESAAKVMNALAAENNLCAQALVDVSRPVDAPLHNEFEWRDDIAACEWRKHQARNIIHSLTIIEDDAPPETEPVRMYFQIEEKSSNYTPLPMILQSADSAFALRDQALRELKAYQKRYAAIIDKIKSAAIFEELQERLEGMPA